MVLEKPLGLVHHTEDFVRPTSLEVFGFARLNHLGKERQYFLAKDIVRRSEFKSLQI
jgi:hypothetical protein